MTQFSLSVQVWGSSRRLHLGVWWPLPERLSWWEAWCRWVEAPGMTTFAVLKKRPSEASRRISLATLWPFHLFMTNCSLQKALVSCLPLDCQKGLLTYLSPHAVAIIYLFTWNGYWSLESVLFLAMAPPHPQSFADSDQLADHTSVPLFPLSSGPFQSETFLYMHTMLSTSVLSFHLSSLSGLAFPLECLKIQFRERSNCSKFCSKW